MPMVIQMIIDYIQTLKTQEEQLLIIVGKPGSGKSKMMRELGTNRGWKYLDAQMLITDELLELVPKARSREASHIFEDILSRQKAEVILLDGLQTFFRPVLNIEPLAVLRQLSRKHILVAAWPGQYQDGKLSFLEVGQTEPSYFDASGIKIVEL